MNKGAIIQKTISILTALPADKVEEVSDFADYLLKKHEEYIMQNGIEKLTEQSRAFEFLNDEDDLYTIEDVKERY